MRDAPVGFQCPDCVALGSKETRSGMAPYGGKRSADPRLTTMVLVGINVAVFVAIQAVPRLADLLVQRAQGMCVAAEGGSWYPGANSDVLCQLTPGVWNPGLLDGALWMPLTAIFTHQAIWHIAGNMLALWFMGPAVESALGRARFLALYLLSGLAGGALALWMMPATGGVLGASGAIWGLMGALLVLARKVKADTGWLVQMIALNVVITVVARGYISWEAHLGGIVGGLLVTAALVYAPKGPRRASFQWGVIGLLTACVLALYAARLLQLG